jgi:hypothetical protein
MRSNFLVHSTSQLVYTNQEKATVYVAAKSDYKASYFYMRIAKIKEIGIGVRFWVSKSQDGKYLIYPYYTAYSYNKELPDYVFLTKEEKISD